MRTIYAESGHHASGLELYTAEDMTRAYERGQRAASQRQRQDGQAIYTAGDVARAYQAGHIDGYQAGHIDGQTSLARFQMERATLEASAAAERWIDPDYIPD